ncbi:MAG TPA: ATP-binding cassette domain-containing protein [Symbiobacteriaceae bacterium]|nr:ATP-binding cassette domain-containing protein [Symbiobacteriaceae bacterium]
MSFIRCESLVKIYKVSDLEVFALQGLDLTVQAGEVMAIIGNSGSGKSTLLNILGGLDQPSAGRCFVGDYDLLRLTDAQRVKYQREAVGFVWQNNARNLIPYLTAMENVALPMQLSGKAGPAVRERAKELLDAVGLADRSHHKLLTLSGGEQQRVAIALALANQPQMLLADEPTGNVDTATAARILEIFRDVNRRWGTTIVIVTHDRTLARAVDRYVLIRDGKVAQEAVRRVVEAPADAAAGQAAAAEHDTHEELVVLDSAGRLQIPRELLQQVGLGDRARVEVEGDRIVVRKP